MSQSNAKTHALAERIGRLFAERDQGTRVDGPIWPSDLCYRKSIIFPIRSAEPIFHRDFRLAVFLPSLAQFMTTSRLPPLIQPFRDARLSRAFDSRPFQTSLAQSLVDLSVLPPRPRFPRFLSRPPTSKQNIGRVLCCGDSGLKGNVFIREKGIKLMDPILNRHLREVSREEKFKGGFFLFI